MKNITYIFSQNRKSKFLDKEIEREFYYGVDFLK